MAATLKQPSAPVLAVVGAALLAASSAALATVPALAASAFKATNHDWVVALNAATVHNVPSGGTFSTCGKNAVSAITPDISYTGAPVGKRYTEEVTGPAGDITITSTHNVDGEVTKLVFTKSSGVWDNTYAIMSFPGSVGHATLPPGKYTFEVVLSGAVVAATSVHLAHKASC
ncbi:MAG TPA: hypothetical protein VME46_08715 [Acidimicrobiales bacterium]|nr:hypothetical protein [Acidimicrobiales bacterium]